MLIVRTGVFHVNVPGVEQGGIEAWFALDKAELLGKDADDYDKVSDTLDVWFDSGTTHTSVLKEHPDLTFPADMYLEGSDQHRGWFHSSLLASVAMHGCAPYREVLTQTADGYRRIRNTSRFLLANLGDFDPARHLMAPADMLPLDRWAVHQAVQAQAKITSAYDKYQFHLVTQELQKFCSTDMGSLFLDITKDRQYTMQADSVGRRSAQTAAYHILQAMVRWMYPVLSFTAEEIYQHLPGDKEESVLFTQWYDGLFGLDADSVISADDWAQVFAVREAVSKQLEQVRAEGKIGAALSAELDIYYSETAGVSALSTLGDELRFVFITSAVRLHDLADKPDTAVEVMEHVFVDVKASVHEKCVRCWHHRADVGVSADHPELCGRCVGNVSGEGETRAYA